MAYDTRIDVEHFAAITGGAMEGGSPAYVMAGNEDGQERVTIWAQDGRRLAAALRRAAAEIDLATLKEVTRQP